ncbi:hypothetical protein CL614_05115 [archaeon]|nr:hypothetical protein [archaeon]|tara:strand:+ start:453 stop:764 length:312 start_codon:yes stop_codon:yes gene_type:complete
MAKKKRNLKCPYCESKDVIKQGVRHNQAVERQMWKCKHCSKKFTVDDGFLRMRHEKKVIKDAMEMRAQGASLADVKARLDARGIKISRWAILKWERKYPNLLK